MAQDSIINRCEQARIDGWILIIVGVLGLIMTTLIWGRRRTVVAPAPVEEREIVTRDPVEYRRVEERRHVDPHYDQLRPKPVTRGRHAIVVAAHVSGWEAAAPDASD